MEPFVYGVTASELIALIVIGYVCRGMELESFSLACFMFGVVWLAMVLMTAVMVTDSEGRTSAWPAAAMFTAIGHLMVTIVADRARHRLGLSHESSENNG